MENKIIEQSRLDLAIETPGLGADRAKQIAVSFGTFWERAKDLCARAELISVTDATQLTEMKHAKKLKGEFRDLRSELDDAREGFKAPALKECQAIDKAARFIRESVGPAEQRLDEMAKFAERAEAARREALRQSRQTLLAPYVKDFTGYSFADMSEETFGTLLANSRKAHEDRMALAEQVERERLAAIAAKEEADRLMRAENERLRLEAVERERLAKIEADRLKAERDAIEEAAHQERLAAQARADVERQRNEAATKEAADKALAEREAIEAKARAEREAAEAVATKERHAREKAESELKSKQDAEKRKTAAEAKAKKAAELAPDKEKMVKLAADIRAFKFPTFDSCEAQSMIRDIKASFERIALLAETKANDLSGSSAAST